ncbi:MAG TPA: acriflavine resistance protein B, partial [Lentisphaeria bacterium]|nr:acriflavine resistance protein B [Lentisphaeria bacterium]
VALPGLSQADLSGVRRRETAIEVAEQALIAYDLTFGDVVNAVRNSSLDLSAGRIRAEGGEILLRTKGQAYGPSDFASIVIRRTADGRQVRVADVAKVIDGFEDGEIAAVFVDIYSVGDQNAIDVTDKVKNYIETAQEHAPAGIAIDYWRDRSKIIRARLGTLWRSAWIGFICVTVLLCLFLRPSVAIWVCVGIPISFAGALLVLPLLGGTINIISAFAFILVLGIVVDDAIVTGENIYTHLQRGEQGESAAIIGTKEVAVPVTFGVLTTAAAFVPLLMIGGFRGKIFAQIPLVVIPVLLFSLVESKLILPAHLRHTKFGRTNAFSRAQQAVAGFLEGAILAVYHPLLKVALQWRYTTLALFIAMAAILMSLRPAGRIQFMPFPRVAAESASATLAMPLGTPFETTHAHVQRIEAMAWELKAKYVDPSTGESAITHVLAETGEDGPHFGRVRFEIVSPEHRTVEVKSTDLANEWRELIGQIPGARDLSFRAELMRGGSPVDVQLTGQDLEQLTAAAAEMRKALATIDGVFDITDSFQDGKQQLELTLRDDAQRLGITTRALAAQVRGAFFGVEAQRIQDGRDDVRVMVRYPEAQRRSLADLESMHIRTPDGKLVPLEHVAELSVSRGAANIQRIDRRRVVSVTADVIKSQVNMDEIQAAVDEKLLELEGQFPGVEHALGGEAKDNAETAANMRVGLLGLLLVIYALLAIPFKDYLQPLLVMLVIPFGAASAIFAHFCLGMPLSMLSLFGILALVGVVINDSLVLVDFINQQRRAGMEVYEAVRTAGVRRLRPILLTSITTFIGLAPLLLEQSTQAQFLKPMAVSLGFGILLTTFVTLLLVPAAYLILESD